MNDSTALVTGANKGIGREIARRLVAAGFTVYFGSRDPERGQRVVDEVGGRARLLVPDVTEAKSIADAARQVEDLDILVNNAGIMVDGQAPPDLAPRAATSDGDPAEAAAGAVRLALLPNDGPTGGFLSWDGPPAPW